MNGATAQRKGSPRVFRFKSFIVVFVGLIAVLSFWVVLSVAWMSREGFWGGVAFLLVGILLFGVLGTMTTLGMSDIVIDEERISRRIFGAEWQSLRWDNVDRIAIFQIPDFGRLRRIRAFKIYPRDGHIARRIAFNEQSGDITDLIELINELAARFSIKIEAEVDGAMHQVSHL